MPLAFRVGQGYAVLFRYGVAVLIGLSPVEEDETLRGLGPRIVGPLDRLEDESATIEIVPDQDDQIEPGGHIKVKDLSPARLVVIADALAKNVALAHDEREVSRVFDVIDPLAANLAQRGRTPGKRRDMLKLIGQALLGASPHERARRGRGKAGRALGPLGSGTTACAPCRRI